jgi:arginyl-tRNA synthetase
MKQIIKEAVEKAIKELYPQAKQVNFSVTVAETKFGDYATNIAMILAREVGIKPQIIAQSLCDALSRDKEKFEQVEVAGPGFINFKIALPYFQKEILIIIKAAQKYGHSDLGKDLKVNIEFISANPTGPLTLGNGRNAYFGDALANVLAKYGATVEREYYVNDRGVQITALGHSVLKDAEAVYKGDYIDEIALQISSKNPGEVGEMAATILMEAYIKKTIAKMGIKFDAWFSEKSLHDSGQVPKALGELEKLGLVYKKEDATWLKTTLFGDDKDRVIVTSLGEYTYFASDIAYHFNKIRRGYDILIDFWGADHHGYIGRLQAAMDMYRKDLNWSGELKIMICQLVRLMSNGQEVRMSKRAGNYVLLDELIDEVGPDVTRFFFLDRTLDTHMEFDLDLAKEKSDKNPVYYIQYAFSRICSILEKVSSAKCQVSSLDLSLLKEEAEIELIKQLIKLPELVEEIAGDYQVQKLAFYARELANSFHHFYEKCPVIKSGSDELTAARLELLRATQIVLKNTLDLIGVSAPEKM